MANLTRWDPFRDLLSIQDEMNQVFNRFFGGDAPSQERAVARRPWAPSLDIAERKDAYVVTVEVPGVKAEDLDITLEDGLLTIQGERKFSEERSEEQYHRVERHYGAFRRSITLPSQVQADRIEAAFEDGVLEVVVPKAEEAKPKKITVRAGGSRPTVEGTSTTAG